MFGLRGAALVAEATTGNCGRCTAQEVEDYLDMVGDQLDIDGDGEREALKDGVLVLRALFGLDGEALVHGAVDALCTRCSAEAIEDYLAGLS
jgi:hypothetical protein